MQLPNTLNTPSFLQKLEWVTNPVRFLEKAAQQYPDIFTAEIVGFGDTIVVVNNPQAIQEILTNDRKKFVAVGEVNKTLQPLLGDYSVIMLEGDRHKHRRQILMPPFHGERLQAYGKIICNIAEKVCGQLPEGKPFLARKAMQDISLEVILQVVFGLYKGERYQQIKGLLASMMETFNSPLNASLLYFTFLQKDLGSWSPWGKFVRLRESIDELLYAVIAERREQPDPNRVDILSLLMSAKDEEGNSMTNQECKDEMMTMLLAGHETTASAMAWGLYWIHHLPEVREQLLQELDTLGNSPDPTTIVRLPYLTAVCNETLRIYPVGIMTFSREVREPVELLGHSLEPGTLLAGCIYLLHQREDLYPQPKQFRPERFLERQFSPYEFMPFGAGVRRCIGHALAPFEMKLVLATILSHYQLALADNRPEKPQRQNVTLSPAGGVKMVMTGKRVHPQSLQAVATSTATQN